MRVAIKLLTHGNMHEINNDFDLIKSRVIDEICTSYLQIINEFTKPCSQNRTRLF